MTDDAFMNAIRERPEDDVPRLVYADWLEERGDPSSTARAAFIRAEQELTSLSEGDARRAAVEGRLRELAREIEPAWLAVVSRPRIEECALSFKFECPQRWDRLTPTKALSVRFCESCRRKVYYCATIDEAQDHAACGHCVAVDARLVREAGDLNAMVLGDVAPPSRPEWDRPVASRTGTGC